PPATSCSLSGRRPASTIEKPSRDSATAAALPTPLPAPVTTAIFCAPIGVSCLLRHPVRRVSGCPESITTDREVSEGPRAWLAGRRLWISGPGLRWAPGGRPTGQARKRVFVV